MNAWKADKAAEIIRTACFILDTTTNYTTVYPKQIGSPAGDLLSIIYDATELYCQTLEEIHNTRNTWSTDLVAYLIKNPSRDNVEATLRLIDSPDYQDGYYDQGPSSRPPTDKLVSDTPPTDNAVQTQRLHTFQIPSVKLKTQPEWTRTTPQEPGIYVYRAPYTNSLGEKSWSQSEKLLFVFEHKGVLRADLGGKTYTIDIGLLDGWWFGPIPYAPMDEEQNKEN